LNWYTWYLIFAISGGITSYLALFSPAKQIALELNPCCVCSTNPILTAIIWVLLSALVIPVLIIPLLIPSKQYIFVATLGKSLAERRKQK